MDTTPITARLIVIANAVNALKSLRQLSYEEFISDHFLTAAAERDFQVAIQAAIDIGATLLAELSAPIPNSYKDVLLNLGEVGILPPDFAKKIAPMAQFRNILVHLYLEVDLKRVYHYLQNDLEDIEQFVQYIALYLKQDPI